MLEKEKLQMDGYFKIALNHTLPKGQPVYGRYTGITTLDSSQYLGDYNLKGIYINEYGMSIRDFFEYVAFDTKILVFHPLKNLEGETLEVDDENPVYIAETVIDYTNSEELFLSDVYTLSIDGIKRYHSTENEKDSYRNNAIKDIYDILMKNEYFTGESLIVNLDSTQKISTKTEIARDESIRKQNIIDVISAQIQRTKAEEDEYNYYTQARLEYEKAMAKFKADTADLENIKQEWVAKFREVDKINEINDKKMERLEQLYDEIKKYYDQVDLPIPPFDQLLP